MPLKAPKRHKGEQTLLEQSKANKAALIKGMELGLSYQKISEIIGCNPITVGNWIKRAYQAEQKLIQMDLSPEEIDELIGVNGDREELVGKYGEGVVTLVMEELFWLKLGRDVKRAEGRAEARMLEVIRGAAIGKHKVVEKKTKSIYVKDPEGGKRKIPAEEITTTEKELAPRWQPAAWFLERKYPEKYSQRKIIEGELPKDIPYEVFMTAKILMHLPKTELERVVAALRERMAPRVVGVGEKQRGLIEMKAGDGAESSDDGAESRKGSRRRAPRTKRFKRGGPVDA
jgi:hypothetical protein